ncbi:receptor-transporting protein 3 [Equus przewalskii]|uniref:Receptor transporter protein 3 n=2 Tax=Equus TaxID=9789 RepID=A0A3Q2I8X1_HORSE|nr:receptor-transporting protein 3 [Equus caballus]XP_008542062.1 PREDICTED: receptor-transporting protein 3 [Equus przewalskii]XP_008542063.1 PREDICTED: receptor-transporting protein 3 [Equus przewalskii]XP_008542064.1 PREDICTED: receptor-transporting protein 3 [Equus przewalskii]XP_008542065.1 PREDICTED: receptor-transporting protein 3 [Equus przewalskii]XP_014587202.2 receptor-transporting protein 3 [Equus caballus]XP_014587203.2 receptor-transporting protein 3 [Equus caballus]XP_01458720
MGQNEEVWKQVFQELIQEVKPWHKWTLRLDESLLPGIQKRGWTQYQQWGFARFQCSSCSRTWASARVQVLFHMHWSEVKSRGRVKMRVFAQRCQKCSQPPFEVPEFTNENISRILNNLVVRILKKCYGEEFKLTEEIPMIREISLEGPHDSDNCEACLQGFCVQRGSGMAVQSPVYPPLLTIGSPISLSITTHKPSPTRSGPSADAAKKGKVLPSPWFSAPTPWVSAPTQAASFPTSWSPGANPNRQEKRVQDSLSSEMFYPYTAQRPAHRAFGLCCCVLILIIIIVTAVTLRI